MDPSAITTEELYSPRPKAESTRDLLSRKRSTDLRGGGIGLELSPSNIGGTKATVQAFQELIDLHDTLDASAKTEDDSMSESQNLLRHDVSASSPAIGSLTQGVVVPNTIWNTAEIHPQIRKLYDVNEQDIQVLGSLASRYRLGAACVLVVACAGGYLLNWGFYALAGAAYLLYWKSGVLHAKQARLRGYMERKAEWSRPLDETR
ncbi:hypothetical protein HZB60_09670 [candidate division KSB1 bacterium]|nr:hypothetical protein [candidate division KSB1 bacterium]